MRCRLLRWKQREGSEVLFSDCLRILPDSFLEKAMALIETEYKTLLIAELNAAEFQTGIDAVWSSWWTLHGPSMESNTDRMELLLKRRLLQYLQGQYRTRYNVTEGKEKRDTFQQFQAVSAMLLQVNAELGPTLDNTPTLGVSHAQPGTYADVLIDPPFCGGKANGCL